MSKKCHLVVILICLSLLISSNTYSSSKKEDIELQDKCEKACEELFKQEYSNGFIDTKDEAGIRNFHNHYNKK
jgi:hypothetical protein